MFAVRDEHGAARSAAPALPLFRVYGTEDRKIVCLSAGSGEDHASVGVSRTESLGDLAAGFCKRLCGIVADGIYG